MRKGGRREEGKDTEKRKIDARFFLHDAAEAGIAVFGDAYIRASSFESLLRVALYLSIVSNIFGFFVVTCPPESREDRLLLRRRSVHYSSPSPLLPPFLLERTFRCFFRTDDFFVDHAPLVPRLPAAPPIVPTGGAAVAAALSRKSGPISSAHNYVRMAPFGAHSRWRRSQRNPGVIYDGPQSSPSSASALREVQ